MRLAFKTKKSAGIRVEPRVYRLLKRGDAARNAGLWAEAAACYRAALALDPNLQHIQLQLGHALKEAGQLEDAAAAYTAAIELRPEDDEAALHRAHLAKRMGRTMTAAAYFAEILVRRSDHAEAQRELSSLIGPLSDSLRSDQLDMLIRNAAALHRKDQEPNRSPERLLAAEERPLVFDVTDLVNHFRHQRLPTGMQRVQIEVLTALLERHGAGRIRACCFVVGRDDWLELPLVLCRDLIRLAAASGDVTDKEWQEARTGLFIHLALADSYILPWGAVIVNLGNSLWVHDYYRFIRNARAERNVSYVPLVHDLIPIMKPEFCVPGILEDFGAWVVGLFQHANGFLAVSQSTKHDLIEVAARLGLTVPESRIEVVPLDADFRRDAAPLPPGALDQWGLADTSFVLFVSTIEPRKNHALAFDGWAELLRRHGPLRVPRLVCAGRDGWMNDDIFDRLDTDPLLAGHVTMIHQASDAELALLHRACRFTLFPSHYEGWGLPVPESLSNGRVPVIADNSSLPEAGAGLALMFASGSLQDFVHAVEKAAFDDDWRTAQEAKIAAEFAPRSWERIADQIESAQARLLADERPDIVPPLAQSGLYYPVSLHKGTGIWPGLGSGEIFRMGDGWEWPETDGSRTRPSGGTLRMRIASGEPLRLYLHLRGLESANCPATATVNGVVVGTMIVRRRKAGWMACDLPANAGPDLEILVQGALSEMVRVEEGGVRKERSVSIAVVGFYLCARDDAAANAAFIQTRRGKLDTISAYRRPGDS